MSDIKVAAKEALQTLWAAVCDAFQVKLVSGTNIKTVNGNSLLGSGDLVVSGGAQTVFYGTCATAAATQAKAVVCADFSSSDLVAGATISVKFTNAQSYNGAPTLNVNSTGAKTIKRYGTTNAARYEWVAGELLTFVYDGTYWVIDDGGIATTTYYGHTKLSSAVDSTVTTLAATPSAVKQAYDLADSKQDALVSGTNIKTINGESLLGSGDIAIGGSYTLPEATATTLGGIKVGDGLDVTSGGVLSTEYPKEDGVDDNWTVYDLGYIDGVGYLKLATRTITGSLAVTTSYGGRYISALQTVNFPSAAISTVLYADVVAASSPGIFHTAKTAISDTSIKYYVVANTSLTQAVTRKLFVVGIY